MIVKTPVCIDVSHWRPVADFGSLNPRPYLVITKATEDVVYVDKMFAPHFSNLKQNGIHRGCFHFHRKAYDPIRQAKHFCNIIRPQVVDTDILILDVEEGGETAAQLQAWFQEAMRQFPNNQMVIYSRKNILNGVPMFMRPFFERFVGHPLNAIQMTIPQREFFKAIPVWTAGYPFNPDLYTSVPTFYIPDQTKWGPVWLWQYTEKGAIQGIVEGVDCNWISPTLHAILQATQPEPAPPDTITYPFPAVKRITGVRYGWNFSLTISDPARVRYEVYHPQVLMTVSSAAKVKGAQLAWNGGEWDREYMPSDYSVSNGQVYVERKEAVPSLLVLNGNMAIDHKDRLGVRQAISGLRYLIRDGVIQGYLSGTEPQYTEGHSRAIDGLNSAGHHMRLSSAGIYPNQGLTLLQAAQVMKQYGALVAFDEGGGGDVTEAINGVLQNIPEDISNGAHVERRLPQILLAYTGGSMNGTAKERLGNISTIRRSPSRYGSDTGQRVSSYQVIEFVEIVPAQVQGTADKVEDQWFKLMDGNYVNYILSGTSYYTILTQPGPAPVPTPTPKHVVEVFVDGVSVYRTELD